MRQLSTISATPIDLCGEHEPSTKRLGVRDRLVVPGPSAWPRVFGLVGSETTIAHHLRGGLDLDLAAQSEGEMSGEMEIIKNLISSITFSILTSIVISILTGVSYRYIYLPCRRRTNLLSRLSPLDFTSDPVYLCYGLIPPDKTSKNFTVAQGDLSTIALGYQVLVENYGRERVRMQNCMVMEPYLHEALNLLSISGPRFNSITKRYMKMLGSPLEISEDPKGLILSRPEGHLSIFQMSTGSPVTLKSPTVRSSGGL